ncbi:MAG: HAD-IA family hydrolase [Melioribacteraceae bacterium]|nr:HAD-IA family hydrolase [Melioribacteraceae bacterium]
MISNEHSHFSGIVFDIDGTLVSTIDLIIASFNHVAQKYLGKTLTGEEIISLFGPTEDVILEEWMGENYESSRKDYYNFYRLNHAGMTKPVRGMKNLLDKIKDAGIPLGIFTGKGRTSSLITLEETGYAEYFDSIITGDDVIEHKPSPEGLLKFVEQFNLLPQNVLMIGDAKVDIIASKKAGTRCATVLWDSYDKDAVVELKSDYYCETVNQLESVIFNSK